MSLVSYWDSFSLICFFVHSYSIWIVVSTYLLRSSFTTVLCFSDLVTLYFFFSLVFRPEVSILLPLTIYFYGCLLFVSRSLSLSADFRIKKANISFRYKQIFPSKHSRLKNDLLINILGCLSGKYFNSSLKFSSLLAATSWGRPWLSCYRELWGRLLPTDYW